MQRFKHILLVSALLFAATGGLSAQEPDSLIIYYTDGVRLAAQDDARGALERLEKALKLAPDHAPSLFETANVLLVTGDTRALEYSARAVELDPGNLWYKRQYGRLLMAMGRYDEALAIYEVLVAQGAHDGDNYQTLAMLYYAAKRTDDALATLDSMGVRMGGTAELIDLKRSILLEAGRMDQAVSETEKYVATAPFDEENRLMLAEMYAYAGRDSLARATLEEVLRINPDNAGAQRLLSPEVGQEQNVEKLLENGDIEGALALLKKELPADGENNTDDYSSLKPYLDIASLEMYLGRADSVILYCNRALELYPHVVALYSMTAMAQQYKGQGKEAHKTLVKSLEVTPSPMQKSDIHRQIGDLWHEQGNDRKAFVAYGKSLRLLPDNAPVLNNYAYFLATGGGNLDKAIKMAERAISLEANNATYLDTYAWILYLQGNYDEAKKAMGQALPLDRENNPELLIHYGDILWALGEDFMATRYWKRAREAGYEPAGEIEERLSRKR